MWQSCWIIPEPWRIISDARFTLTFVIGLLLKYSFLQDQNEFLKKSFKLKILYITIIKRNQTFKIYINLKVNLYSSFLSLLFNNSFYWTIDKGQKIEKNSLK